MSVFCRQNIDSVEMREIREALLFPTSAVRVLCTPTVGRGRREVSPSSSQSIPTVSSSQTRKEIPQSVLGSQVVRIGHRSGASHGARSFTGIAKTPTTECVGHFHL